MTLPNGRYDDREEFKAPRNFKFKQDELKNEHIP